MGWLTPRPGRFTPRERDTVPFIQQAGLAPRPVWMCAENIASTGIGTLDLPAPTKSLYDKLLRPTGLDAVLRHLSVSIIASFPVALILNLFSLHRPVFQFYSQIWSFVHYTQLSPIYAPPAILFNLLPFLNTITFVLRRLHFRLHFLQQVAVWCFCLCKTLVKKLSSDLSTKNKPAILSSFTTGESLFPSLV